MLGSSGAPAIRAWASACSTRATAAPMSWLFCWAVRIRPSSWDEPKLRHQPVSGQVVPAGPSAFQPPGMSRAGLSSSGPAQPASRATVRTAARGRWKRIGMVTRRTARRRGRGSRPCAPACSRRSRPVANAQPKASSTGPGENTIGVPKACSAAATARPPATPMTPPSAETTTASVRNCCRMSRMRAPVAMRTPISRVRSVTLTSMMFMTPMPPTSSEIAAIEPSRIVSVFCVSVAVSRSATPCCGSGSPRVRCRASSSACTAACVSSICATSSTATVIVAQEALAEQPQAAGRERHEDDVVLVGAIRRGALRAPSRRSPGTARC